MNAKHSLISMPFPLSQSPQILAVDDDEDNLLLLAHFLESLGCNFLTAGDGEKTLFLAAQHQPDLILLDLVLPEMSGFETLQRLKANSRSRQIPVIAVTGLALAEERQQIQDAGFDDYLCKPYLLSDLEAVLRRHLPEMAFPTLMLDLPIQSPSAQAQI
jgi:two-component system cell cycle response regulator DivK